MRREYSLERLLSGRMRGGGVFVSFFLVVPLFVGKSVGE